MEKTKHTPGPWFSAGILTGGSIDVRADGGRMQVARVNGMAGEQEANATLIAAAPELLDALRETLRALEAHLDESCRDHGLGHRDLLCPCNQEEVVRARLIAAAPELLDALKACAEAIRKATGEE